MISNPKNGWCDFRLRTFTGNPSYLTDVPVDLLQAFIDYHQKGHGMAWFDEEGTEFSLVITPYSLFIIEEKDTPVLHDFSEMFLEKIEKELIDDIEKDLDGWANYATSDNPKHVQIHRDNIVSKLAELKINMRNGGM